ncbi:MAG: hypothetical protein IEMM0002_0565 [bacterium]|nr:MAG: hypothetical protein IEMM0002_0565 [bacterium]
MLDVDWNNFINNFDFTALADSLISGSWKWILKDKIVWGVVIVFLALIAYQQSRDFATLAAGWGITACLYFLGGVILKNSVISEPGPFAVLVAMFLVAVGYLIWTKLLKS